LGLLWAVAKLRPTATVLGLGLLAAPALLWRNCREGSGARPARREIPEAWQRALREGSQGREHLGGVTAPVVAWSAGRHGLAWLAWDQAQDYIRFRALTAEGVPVGRLATLAEGELSPARVTAVRDGFGVGWTVRDWERQEVVVYAAAVSPEGTPRRPPLALTPRDTPSVLQEVAPDGDGMALTGYRLEDRTAVFLARVAFTGQPIGRAVTVLELRQPSWEQLSLHRVEGGLEVSVAEMNFATVQTTLRAVRIPDRGGSLAPRLLWTTDGTARGISTRRLASESVGVYLDDVGPLRGTPMAFAFGDGPGARQRALAARCSTGGVALAQRGAEAAAVWARIAGDDTAVLLQRIDGNAQPVGAVQRIDGEGPDVRPGARPSVTATDGGYTVVWEGPRATAAGLWLRRTDPRGAPVALPLRVVEP
jgi:hypothetical protein